MKAIELLGRALLFFHQWRASEADETSLRQRLEHLDVRLAVLTSMAFINEHEEVFIVDAK